MKLFLAAAGSALVVSTAFVVNQLAPEAPSLAKGDKLPIVATIEPQEPMPISSASATRIYEPAIPKPIPAPEPTVATAKAQTQQPKEFCSRYGLRRISLRNGHWKCSRY